MDKELDFLLLCAPLEDAINLLDAGETAKARALLVRLAARARAKHQEWECADRQQ